MLFSGNTIFTPIAVMGTIMAGGIYNSTNPAFTSRELAYQMRVCDPTFLIVADNCVERAIEAAKSLNFNRERIYLYNDLELISGRGGQKITSKIKEPLIKCWSDIIASPEEGSRFRWEELDTPELTRRPAMLIFSSGTTGLPKGVELSHRALTANISQLLILMGMTKDGKPLSTSSNAWKRRSLCCLPMYHGLGLTFYTIVAPKVGIQTYIMERYNLDDMLANIQRFRITELVLVPPILVSVAKHPAVRAGKYDLSSVRKVIAGAAPIGMEITQQFESVWNGKVRIRQGWGLTE